MPFFSCAASEFVEVFVGVGASRVRDLFEKVRKPLEDALVWEVAAAHVLHAIHSPLGEHALACAMHYPDVGCGCEVCCL